MQKNHLRAWIIWLSAGIFYLYEFIHRVAISVMLPELEQSLNVSVASLGILSACYFYAYAIAQIPVGLILDRYNTREILTKACAAIAFASLIFAFTSNLFVAEISRVIIGLGSAFAFVGCLKLGSIWFHGKQFGLIIGLTNLLGISGAIIGGKPTALAVDYIGWRNVMIASALIGILVAILLWQTITEKDHDQIKNKPSLKNIIKSLSEVVKCRQIWIIASFGGFMVAPIGAYSELWGVPFLINNYHLDRPTAAQISTLTFVGIAIGGPTIGWLSDKLHRNKPAMLIGAVGASICMSLIILGPSFPIWLVGLLHCAFGFFTSAMLLSFSLATSVCTTGTRATTIAFVNTIIMSMVALMQSVLGYLLEISQANFTLSLMPIILCYLFAFTCYNTMREPRGKNVK